ncbi:MAG TPA: hypothetical protein VFB93_13750 [Burkholderiales bacterium]|nr:hypothetical protein [Burkholderiales bacterium]
MRVLLLLCLLSAAAHAVPPLPARLEETGIEGATLAFTPQHALWSDGSAKRRWLYLPPGSTIDAARPDAWEFPRGTKAWKQFSRGGRIETRFIERLPDGSWRFAAYQWNAQGSQALLAPPEGVPAVGIPSRADCLACHEGAAVPILGFSAVQLGPELKRLAAQGLVRNLPPALLESPPRLAPGLGYLHANCGHCHNDAGPLAGVELALAQRAAAPRESAERSLRSLAARRDDVLRRLRSANPYVRMPPLGTRVVDADGVALVESLLQSRPKELSP